MNQVWIRAGIALTAGLFSALAVAAENVTVRLDFTPVGFHAAMHLAKEKGWFAREGLDVDIQDGAGSLNTILLVGNDQIDIGQVQLGLMAMALEKNLTIKSFAGFLRKGDLAVMVPRDSNIDKLQDLKGKKITCFTASPWAPFIDSFLARGGLDRNSVQIVMVAPPAMAALYTAKDFDGFMSVEPYAVPVVEKGRPAKTIRLADYGISFPSYGLIATQKTLDTRKDMLRKFTKVQVETWEYIWKGNQDEAVQAMMKQRAAMKLDPTVLKAQLELNRGFFDTANTKGKRIGWQSSADWAAAIASMKEAGAIAGKFKPEDYFTNALLPE
jgi:NitT/TauT family transport system substrate-binding protein